MSKTEAKDEEKAGETGDLFERASAEDAQTGAGSAAAAAPATHDGEDAGSREDRDGRKEAAKEAPIIPERIDLNNFQKEGLVSLYELGASLGLRVGGSRSKHQIVFELLLFYGHRGARIEAEGIFEPTKDGFGFLRWPETSFSSLPDNVFLPQVLVRQHGIRAGNRVRVVIKRPREREKHLMADAVISIEGIPIDEWKQPAHFEKLTALSPRERIILEHPDKPSPAPRVVDLMAPLGKGQRGLICAPPRGGKTILLKEIATSIRLNHPEVELIILLLDERPEEVTDFTETVNSPVYSSTFDETPQHHVMVAELVSERAKRLVELGKDVVILLDSLTRLARAYNALMGGKGGVMSGGLHKQALEKPRRFFGSARNVEEGGSLTILATALIETESRMDEVIFEEFKGTGNMEIQLDRELVEKRIFPAIHILKSGTRKDDLLYHPDEFRRILALRRQLTQLPAVEAMEVLIKNIRRTSSNAELLLSGIR